MYFSMYKWSLLIFLLEKRNNIFDERFKQNLELVEIEIFDYKYYTQK